MSNSSQGPNPVDLIMQTASGYMASSCIHAIARLKIADLLTASPKNVSELASATSTNADIFTVRYAL
jgi:hypothetical protein